MHRDSGRRINSFVALNFSDVTDTHCKLVLDQYRKYEYDLLFNFKFV